MSPSPDSLAKLAEGLTALLAFYPPASFIGSLSPEESEALISQIAVFCTRHPPQHLPGARRPLACLLSEVAARCFSLCFELDADADSLPPEAFWVIHDELTAVDALIHLARHGYREPLALPA